MDVCAPGSVGSQRACAPAHACLFVILPLFPLQVCFDINGQLLDMCLEKEAPSHSCNTLEDVQVQAKTDQGKACKSCQTGGCDAGGGGRDLGEARDGAAGDWWVVAVAGRGEGTTGAVADKAIV